MRNTKRGLAHPRLFCAVMIALIVGLGSLVAYIAIYDPDPLKNMRHTEYTYEPTYNYANSTEVTTQETTTNTETTAVPTENNAIEIVGGQENEYYRAFCYNESSNNLEDKNIIDCYFVPAGKYKIINHSGYPRKILIYNANSLTTNSNGFEEFADGLESDGLIENGFAVEATIESGWFIKTSETINNPDQLTLQPLGATIEQDLSKLSDRFYIHKESIDTSVISVETTAEQTQATTVETEEPEETTQKPTETEKKEVTVYITDSGEKYHKDGCSSLSKSKHPISLDEAKSRGYEPCKKCHPPT